jgi:hypothetical protein
MEELHYEKGKHQGLFYGNNIHPDNESGLYCQY